MKSLNTPTFQLALVARVALSCGLLLSAASALGAISSTDRTLITSGMLPTAGSKLNPTAERASAKTRVKTHLSLNPTNRTSQPVGFFIYQSGWFDRHGTWANGTWANGAGADEGRTDEARATVSRFIPQDLAPSSDSSQVASRILDHSITNFFNSEAVRSSPLGRAVAAIGNALESDLSFGSKPSQLGEARDSSAIQQQTEPAGKTAENINSLSAKQGPETLRQSLPAMPPPAESEIATPLSHTATSPPSESPTLPAHRVKLALKAAQARADLEYTGLIGDARLSYRLDQPIVDLEIRESIEALDTQLVYQRTQARDNVTNMVSVRWQW